MASWHRACARHKAAIGGDLSLARSGAAPPSLTGCAASHHVGHVRCDEVRGALRAAALRLEGEQLHNLRGLVVRIWVRGLVGAACGACDGGEGGGEGPAGGAGGQVRLSHPLRFVV